MDLRKNLPVQSENSPPQVKGSKKAFFQLVGGLVAIIALLFSMQSGYQSKPNTSNVQNVPKPAVAQKVAEVANQGNSKILQNAFDILNQGSNKIRNNASNVIAQRSKPQRTAPQSSKPPQSASKPVAQTQVKPTAPRSTNVASSAGKTKGLLNKAVTIGKFGLAIISKGKIRIR
ncbi:MAG: hypothetical protein IJQ82_07515 [Selenomonadaceae bacterium]|nr:hypothetical protein [Selenomonadaceae bacterium]